MKKKAFAKAIEDFSKVLEAQPDDTNTLFQRGTAFEKLECVDEVCGNMWQLRLTSLVVKRFMSTAMQAIADFTAVLSLDSTHVSAAYARAACHNRKVLTALPRPHLLSQLICLVVWLSGCRATSRKPLRITTLRSQTMRWPRR